MKDFLHYLEYPNVPFIIWSLFVCTVSYWTGWFYRGWVEFKKERKALMARAEAQRNESTNLKPPLS